jgi:hypothetical protein
MASLVQQIPMARPVLTVVVTASHGPLSKPESLSADGTNGAMDSRACQVDCHAPSPRTTSTGAITLGITTSTASTASTTSSFRPSIAAIEGGDARESLVVVTSIE